MNRCPATCVERARAGRAAVRVRSPARRPGPSRRQRAQSSVEYLIVVSLLAMALLIGPDSALEQLFRAFADHYQKFTYAMSRP